MIKGSIVALVTPMRADGAVDHDALAVLVERQVEAGTAAIVSVGTTGESATLDVAEHTEVIRRTIDVVAGRVPAMTGTRPGHRRDRRQLDVRGHPSDAGGARGRRGRRAAGHPVLQQAPAGGALPALHGRRRGRRDPADPLQRPRADRGDMLPSTVERLAAVPNIVGIKEAKGDLDRVRDLVALGLEGFALYSGDDATARASILAGFHGDISVTANVAPAAMARMCAAALAGDAEKAAVIDADLAGLHRALFVEPNPIPVKWALAELGLMGPGIRLPLVPLDPALHEDVRAALQAAGLTA